MILQKSKALVLLTVIVLLLIVVILGVAFIFSGDDPDKTSEAQNTERIETGAALYEQHCLSCHGGEDAELYLGEPPPHNSEGHTWHHADAELIKWILEGKPYNMPAFGESLSEQDVEAILSFIKTWWDPSQRETQARISKEYQEALDKYQQESSSDDEKP